MNIILLGPPGAGKGTQAERLCARYDLVHVASGDLFRDNLSRNTALGKQARAYMDAGELVPDDLTSSMVEERLSMPDCESGVVLDGFPRTQRQAESLMRILRERGRELQAVLSIAVPDEILIRRLTGRRICQDCQIPYHIEHHPPQEEGVCDECGGELIQRDDDREETIVARLNIYHEQTAPLIDYYRASSLLSEVDGSGTIDEIADQLGQVVEDRGS